MIFETLLIMGSLGFVVLALLGMGHSGGHAGGHSGGLHGHGGAHAGHALGHGHGSHATAIAKGGHQGQGHDHGLAKHAKSVDDLATPLSMRVLSWLSPITFCSLLMGAGLTGFLLQGRLPANIVTITAIIGAIVFNLGVVRPIMNAVLRFGGNPSRGLEGAVALDAEAVTSFDSTGKGLVRLVLEGQTVQLLARLDPGELQSGCHVQKGDQVIVTEVDSKTNCCTVTRELSE